MVQCANCGNADQAKLFDEDDTFYCSECCHRTLKRNNADDLVWCPTCGMLRDRKASACLWCNSPLDSNPPTYEEYQENSSDWFIKDITEQNKRYWRIRKERLTYSTLISRDFPPVPLHFAPDIEPSEGVEDESIGGDHELITIAIEGKKKVVYGTRYERNPKLRKAAIQTHGCKCAVCSFDFEKTYGALGRGFIEVHHIKPISSIAQEHEVNVDRDLVCLCSNCHRMVHRGENGTVISIERLRDIIGQ